MTILKCISPIDGSVYAERPTQSFDEASAAIAKARAARKDWARQPLDKRIKLVMAGVARLNEMVDEAVPELAHMIGQPIVGQAHAIGAKGMALDHISAGDGVGLMHRRHPARSRHDQLFQALFTAGALGIEHRPHATVAQERLLL